MLSEIFGGKGKGRSNFRWIDGWLAGWMDRHDSIPLFLKSLFVWFLRQIGEEGRKGETANQPAYLRTHSFPHSLAYTIKLVHGR